jgi:hypothetical protein
MTKRLSREQKREKAIVDIINKMFEVAGHSVTYEDVRGRKDNWFQQWTMTVKQNEEWKVWGTEYLRKELRMNKKRASVEMDWMSLMWGLKFSDFDKINLDK